MYAIKIMDVNKLVLESDFTVSKFISRKAVDQAIDWLEFDDQTIHSKSKRSNYKRVPFLSEVK